MHEDQKMAFHMNSSLSLVGNVVQQVGRAIVANEFASVNFPREEDLSQQLNVSRSVIREALKVLASKGMLHAVPRRGTSVLPETQWNLLDPDLLFWLMEQRLTTSQLVSIAEVRMSIEPMAAELAARRADPTEIDILEQALSGMERAMKEQGDMLAPVIDFYVAILAASGNPFISQFRNLVEAVIRYGYRFKNQKGVVQLDNQLESCRKVMRAIKSKEPSAAKKEMKQLIATGLNQLN